MKYYVVLLIAIIIHDSTASLLNFDLYYSCRNVQKSYLRSRAAGRMEFYDEQLIDTKDCNSTLTLMNTTETLWYYSLNSGDFGSLYPIISGLDTVWTFVYGFIPPRSYVNLSLQGETALNRYLVCATSHSVLQRELQKINGTRTRKRTESDWKKLKDVVILQGNFKEKEATEKDNVIVITGNTPKKTSFLSGPDAGKNKEELMQKLSLAPKKETRSRLQLVG